MTVKLIVTVNSYTSESFAFDCIEDAECAKQEILRDFRGSRKWIDLGETLINKTEVATVRFNIIEIDKVQEALESCPAETRKDEEQEGFDKFFECSVEETKPWWKFWGE